jgi:4-oxalocrotonate tautomerase
MPQIDVHLIKGVFNTEQKKQIIQKLTDAMVSVEGENMRGVTWVKIFEVNSGEWGIGGQPLTTEAVKELAAGRCLLLGVKRTSPRASRRSSACSPLGLAFEL